MSVALQLNQWLPFSRTERRPMNATAQLAKTGVGVEKVGQEKVFWVEYVLADLFFSQFA
jgi:hypothetical protein